MHPKKPVNIRCVSTVGALREMRRVLKPGGQLWFVEHWLAPEEGVRKWQNRLTPVWKRIGGGCHLNRPIGDFIESAGFGIVQVDTGYMKGPQVGAMAWADFSRHADLGNGRSTSAL